MAMASWCGSALGKLSAAYRRRALAGDERAGAWARGQARRRWYAFVRERWLLLTTMAVVAAIPITLVALVVGSPFVRGLVVGAGGTATVAALCSLVVQATGTSLLMSGATAEQWTAQELRPLGRDAYRLINGVLLGFGDTDHVLVGPAGVLVVETKWTSHSWTLDEPNAQRDRAVEQVDARARRLNSWARYRALKLPPPRPVLFLWSPYGTTPSDGPLAERLRADPGHTIVWGRDAAKEWRSRVRSAPTVLTTEMIDAVVDALVAQSDAQESAINEEERNPPSITRLYWTAFGTAMSFIIAVIIGSGAISTLRTPFWVGVLLAQAALGLVASRFSAIRAASLAWLAGTTTIAVLAAAFAVLPTLCALLRCT